MSFSIKGVPFILLLAAIFLTLLLDTPRNLNSIVLTPVTEEWPPPSQAGDWFFTARPAHMPGNPCIADLNGDGLLEIILGAYDGQVYAWQHNGTILPGWPQLISPMNRVFSSPAVADLDNDSILEVVVGSDRYVSAWRSNGSLLPGWPKKVSGWFQSSPSLVDLDGDHDLEIVIGGNDSYVYAWHHNGQAVAGWPQKTNGRVTSSPAIGDLVPSQPGPEIIIGSEDNFTYAWHSNGSMVRGFPVDLGAPVLISSPALADLTGDGRLEIVICAFGYYGPVYAIRSDGSILDGWPKETAKKSIDPSGIFASPALGDLSGNGFPEIVVMTLSGLLTVLEPSGKTLWSKDIFAAAQSSPTIADIDGDREPEILVVGWTGWSINWTLFAFESNGSNSTGWPLEIIYNPTQSQPTVADLDADGDTEIILATGAYANGGGSYGALLVLDLLFRFHSNRNPWPAFRANKHHSGVLDHATNWQHPTKSDDFLEIAIILGFGTLAAAGVSLMIIWARKR
ncbi:MAG: FG-GAP repeat domain-containing protein [Candidatus Hodarchaeota archaeon]